MRRGLLISRARLTLDGLHSTGIVFLPWALVAVAIAPPIRSGDAEEVHPPQTASQPAQMQDAEAAGQVHTVVNVTPRRVRLGEPVRMEVVYHNRGTTTVVIRRYLIEWPMVSAVGGAPADWDDEYMRSGRLPVDESEVRLRPGMSVSCLMQPSLYPVGVHRVRLHAADPKMAELLNPTVEGVDEFEVLSPQEREGDDLRRSMRALLERAQGSPAGKQNDLVRRRICYALAYLHPWSEPVLIVGLGSADARMRDWALESLRIRAGLHEDVGMPTLGEGQDASQIMAAMESLVKDEADPYVRYLACAALGAFAQETPLRVSESGIFRTFIISEMRRPDSVDKGVMAACALARHFPGSREVLEDYLRTSPVDAVYKQQIIEAVSETRQ